MKPLTLLVGLSLSFVAAQSAEPQTEPLTQAFRETITVRAPAPITSRTPNEHVLTFAVPLSIPGAMLEPGTYLFRVTAPATIQVLGHDGAKAYAQFHTLPIYGRDEALMDSTYEMTFIRAANGAPRQLVKLFVPGRLEGHELFYGHRGKPSPNTD